MRRDRYRQVENRTDRQAGQHKGEVGRHNGKRRKSP
jgi:hypothetical protein